jgi:hypothetical protein
VAHALLEALLREPRSAVIGGLAVAAHGYIRATRDVDLVVGIPLAEAQQRLSAAGIVSTLHRGDALEGDFDYRRGVLHGVPFDLLPELVPVAWDRRDSVHAGDAQLEIVDLESLLDLKLLAGSPRDLVDAAMLSLLHPEARALARLRQRDELFERYLADPRHRASAAALAAGEGPGETD